MACLGKKLEYPCLRVLTGGRVAFDWTWLPCYTSRLCTVSVLGFRCQPCLCGVQLTSLSAVHVGCPEKNHSLMCSMSQSCLVCWPLIKHDVCLIGHRSVLIPASSVFSTAVQQHFCTADDSLFSDLLLEKMLHYSGTSVCRLCWPETTRMSHQFHAPVLCKETCLLGIHYQRSLPIWRISMCNAHRFSLITMHEMKSHHSNAR